MGRAGSSIAMAMLAKQMEPEKENEESKWIHSLKNSLFLSPLRQSPFLSFLRYNKEHHLAPALRPL